MPISKIKSLEFKNLTSQNATSSYKTVLRSQNATFGATYAKYLYKRYSEYVKFAVTFWHRKTAQI